MRILMVGIAVLGLGGCTYAKAFVTPDGKPAYLVDCTDFDMTVCHARARKVCGGNYTVLNQSARIEQGLQVGEFDTLLRLQVVCANSA